MSLTVLSIAYPFSAVGPDAVGGAEQILGQLDAALVAAGHRSVVVANASSKTSGVLIGTELAADLSFERQRQLTWAEHRRNIARAMTCYPADLIHMHGIDFPRYLPAAAAVPVLVTLHLPPSWYEHEVFDNSRPAVHLHCVSRSQHRACPPGARLLPVIDNGVPLRALECRCRKRRFALSLGRICPEKNLHVALEAGRRAGVPVLLGGQVFPYEAHERYFRDEVAPRLDRERRLIGAVPFQRKRRLLSAARCLLLPTLAAETSSLVAMEALACGTPVVAFPNGALPEIIEHGITGFLVRNATEMAEAIRACGEIEPARCRAAARERFSLERMIRRYFDVYEQLTREA